MPAWIAAIMPATARICVGTTASSQPGPKMSGMATGASRTSTPSSGNSISVWRRTIRSRISRCVARSAARAYSGKPIWTRMPLSLLW